MLRLSYLRLSSRSNEGIVHSVQRRLSASAFALAAFTGGAQVAQEAAAPAPAIALPQVDVTTGAPKKKTVNAKGGSQESRSGAFRRCRPRKAQVRRGWCSREGGSKPGLNLDVPTETGSRLGITPLETPASVEIIPGATIKERKQTTVSRP